MEDQQMSGGAAIADDGIKAEQAQQEAAVEETKEAPNGHTSIRPEDHKRAIDDMMRYKKEKLELEARVKMIEEEKLKEKEDWKTLADRYKTEAEEYKTKYQQDREAYIENEKFNAVKAHLLKSGLINEAEQDLDLLDLKGVQYELTSGGRVIIHGADAYAEEVRKNRPHWFKKAATVPNINSGGAGGNTVSDELLTPQKLVELERKYLREGRKDKVVELYQRYQKQRLKR